MLYPYNKVRLEKRKHFQESHKEKNTITVLHYVYKKKKPKNKRTKPISKLTCAVVQESLYCKSAKGRDESVVGPQTPGGFPKGRSR